MNAALYQPAVCIDMKKKRIRIYKAALNQIGMPAHIELLVNPGRMCFAIRKSEGGKNSHRIKSVKQHPYSYEIYSKSFVDELLRLDKSFDTGRSYTIAGKTGSANIAVWFFLKDAVMNEGGKGVTDNG